jgi:hypothetical protein
MTDFVAKVGGKRLVRKNRRRTQNRFATVSARSGGEGAGRACPLCPGISDVDLLGDRESVIHLNPEIPDCAFNLRMAEQ